MGLQAKVYTRTNDSGTHYARIVVPKALRLFVKKPALWKSLSTKDDKEATKAGSIVAASTQLVLQEVSDANAEAVVVTVETELVGNKFDLGKALDKIPQEDILLVAQSLREKLGINTGDGEKPGGGTKAVGGKKTEAKSTVSKKTSAGKNEVSEPTKMEQCSTDAVNEADVARYIEKRPHGVFRFRYWISKKLQSKFGKREVRQTLHTRDRDVAIRRAQPILVELKRRLMFLEQEMLV